VEGDALESTLKRAVDAALMRPEEHGRKAGYVLDRGHTEARVLLGEFSGLNGEAHDDAEPASPRPYGADDDATHDDDQADDDEAAAGATEPEAEGAPADAGAPAAPKKRRRGRRGGRGRHKPAASAAD